MSDTFFQRLERRARATGSLLCVGLDPHIADLREPTADAALEHCRHLVSETRGLALAYKPNAAFFEVFGAQGWAALAQLIADIGPDVPVILDAKRGDIDSTAAAYARATFDGLGADAVTVSPWMGLDSLTPWLQRPDRGVFALCRTSNAGASDLQTRWLIGSDGDGAPAWRRVVELTRPWHATHAGLVVGATAPEDLAAVRRAAPRAWLLVPGVGTQGGDLARVLRSGRRDDGLGLLINVSRSLARAPSPRDYAQDLVLQMAQVSQPPLLDDDLAAVYRNAELARGLVRLGCVQFGEFTLKSGLQSPFYLDLRRLCSDPVLLRLTAAAYLECLQTIRGDRLAALPYAALPLGAAVAALSQWSLIYPRREAKDYGTGHLVEGLFAAGETAVILDDLATTGASKLEAAAKLAAVGLQVRDVVVLIDRGSGAGDELAAGGLALHAALKLPALVAFWQAEGLLDAEGAARIHSFLAATAKRSA